METGQIEVKDLPPLKKRKEGIPIINCDCVKGFSLDKTNQTIVVKLVRWSEEFLSAWLNCSELVRVFWKRRIFFILA